LLVTAMQALLFSSLVGLSLAYDAPSSARKSLSFGPVLPHAKFVVNPPSGSFHTASAQSTDPKQVASEFVNQLAQDYQTTGYEHTFFIREDSYTDTASGVSHYYARQLVQGIEVADGNININIFNGKVISYGDSVSLSSSHRSTRAPEVV
jgi:extracellular elastinolytic metalloproteinase